MRINIVYAAGFQLPPALTAARMKDIGPTWGSWRTWRSCDTDNVVCHDLGQARELYQRAVQAVCNFYIPQKFYPAMNRPTGVKIYQGDFVQETVDLEDVICMHLVSDLSDLVLMFGFDLCNPGPIDDRMDRHRMTNRFGLIRQAMMSAKDVQWILVDHAQTLDTAFDTVPNLTCDTTENVLQLLG